MAGMYGDFVARTVSQGKLQIDQTSWTALQVGSSPLANRRHVRIQVKGRRGSTVAVAYAAKNADGTYTTPTTGVATSTIYAGGAIWVEPVGDTVTIYGRMQAKAGVTDNTVSVIVTEFA